MTVSELIEQMTLLQEMGYGAATVRSYSEVVSEYSPVRLVLHRAAENEDCYPKEFEDWVEIM